jgi:transcriptional regulator of NAD metabolism
MQKRLSNLMTECSFSVSDKISGKEAPMAGVPASAAVGEVLKKLEESGFGPFSELEEGTSAVDVDGQMHTWSKQLEKTPIGELGIKEDGSSVMTIWKTQKVA